MSQTKMSVAKDVFAYLLTFVMLYIGVVDFISLLWNIISVQFPDPATYSWMNPYGSMRSSIATLVIVWPVFLLMSRYLVLDLKRHPEKAELWVRRWLTYLTIFVAAITIIVDLITLLDSFLGGELTTRFVLKVLSVLVVAAVVLGYEFWELKRKPEEGKKELRSMAVASLVLIILAMVGGFYFVGTPGTARQYTFDGKRVNDLQNLQGQIINYWNLKDVLPDNLEMLKDPINGFTVPLDPQTNQPYEYTVKSELKFELCALFALNTPAWERAREKPEYMMYDDFGNRVSNDWNHEAGRTCFERTIDPELHKVPKLGS